MDLTTIFEFLECGGSKGAEMSMRSLGPADVLAGRLATAPAGEILPPQLEGRERVRWDERAGDQPR